MDYISKEGLEKLKKELEELRTKKRLEIASRIEESKKLGDLSENSEYQEAREAQELNERKISELEEVVRNAVIIETRHTENVGIGSKVAVEFMSDGGVNNKKIEFTIVGSTESDPNENKISNESPLGRAFLNKRVGDKVEAKTPKGILKYKILSIK